MRRAIFVLGAVAAITCLPTLAMAQWADDFDSYPLGPANAGGWAGWGGSAASEGVITDAVSLSPRNSIQVGGSPTGAGNDDAVHPFAGYTSGQWTITAHQYIPDALASTTYFIVNNQYSHPGPFVWSVEISANPGGDYLDDFRPESNVIPVVLDQWVEFRMEIDLDADTMDTYVGGVLLSTGTYTRNPGDPLEIANIDLFTTGNQTAHYDDLSLVPEPASCLLLAAGAVLALRRRS